MSFKPKKKPEPLEEAALFDYAVKALGRRMRTEAELKRLMRTRVEPELSGDAKIAAVLIRLKEYGYLNDASFAETYTRLRQENEKFGERRVKQDLQQKGVHESLIAEAVEARYGQTDEVALARQFIEKKRLRPPENQKETVRIMRRLVMAGFTTGTIRKVLGQWNVDDGTLQALDSLDEELEELPED
jgi:regulatory protein